MIAYNLCTYTWQYWLTYRPRRTPEEAREGKDHELRARGTEGAGGGDGRLRADMDRESAAGRAAREERRRRRQGRQRGALQFRQAPALGDGPAGLLQPGDAGVRSRGLRGRRRGSARGAAAAAAQIAVPGLRALVHVHAGRWGEREGQIREGRGRAPPARARRRCCSCHRDGSEEERLARLRALVDPRWGPPRRARYTAADAHIGAYAGVHDAGPATARQLGERRRCRGAERGSVMRDMMAGDGAPMAWRAHGVFIPPPLVDWVRRRFLI